MATIGSASNKRIIDLYNDMKNGVLVTKPEFQRKLVWNDNHKENFIDTILNGLPFPEIYLADGEIDLELKIPIRLIVDGQQRLTTIYQYIINSNDFVLKRIKRYPELTPEEQTKFLDYVVVVRDLGRISDDTIREIFRRINSVQYALNAMEINNALYEGEFINTAKYISEMSSLKDLEIFSDNDYARMEDYNFILLVMATAEIGGYFTRDKEVETFIKVYDNEYPYKDIMKNDMISVIQLVYNLKLNPDVIWFRKSVIFTLISELIFYKRRHGRLPEIGKLYSLLCHLNKVILDNKDKDLTNEYAQFYNYMYSGTSRATARRMRGALLGHYLERIDQQRFE